jgi:tRNA U34 5-carboxymethylaminomethyl modifying GTPase MnmE/TrmE
MGERTFAEERDRLRDALAELADFADERESSAVAEAARALDKKLVENRFNAVVLGAFKRGKTTFVNALLGAEMLPASVVPLTSIVTAVTYGDEIRARIEYLDGREEDVSVQDLTRWVTERDNPANHRGIRHAVLSYPSEDLHDGVFLVDTPGVGSIHRHNTEAARQFLPESDAAIFLTSADPPISDSERAFLEETRGEAARMFFVLNKVDYLSGLDREEAIAFTHGVIADAVGHDIVLYPMSARRALLAKLVGDEDELEASGLPPFERDLRAFLLREKGRTIVQSVAGRALRLADDERNSLDVQERALGLPQQELDEARRRMEEVFARARRAQRDTHALLKQETDALVSDLEADLAVLRSEETARLLAVAEEYLSTAEDLRSAAEDLDELVKNRLRTVINLWRREEERRLGEAFRDATARFVEEADRTERETLRLCGEILGIELASRAAPVDLSSETRFSYDLLQVPTILGSILPDVRRFLPTGTARRLIERDIRRRIPELVDKHSGRLRWDFVQRLERSRRELQLALDERLDATIEGLRAGIERSERDRQRSVEDALRAEDDVRAERLRLDRLRRAFQMSLSGSGFEEVPT